MRFASVIMTALGLQLVAGSVAVGQHPIEHAEGMVWRFENGDRLTQLKVTNVVGASLSGQLILIRPQRGGRPLEITFENVSGVVYPERSRLNRFSYTVTGQHIDRFGNHWIVVATGNAYRPLNSRNKCVTMRINLVKIEPNNISNKAKAPFHVPCDEEPEEEILEEENPTP